LEKVIKGRKKEREGKVNRGGKSETKKGNAVFAGV
jgi:hypothetical protein